MAGRTLAEEQNRLGMRVAWGRKIIFGIVGHVALGSSISRRPIDWREHIAAGLGAGARHDNSLGAGQALQGQARQRMAVGFLLGCQERLGDLGGAAIRIVRGDPSDQLGVGSGLFKGGDCLRGKLISLAGIALRAGLRSRLLLLLMIMIIEDGGICERSFF
ncbi:hypothetical protein EKD04_016670 [Chloroflexales bacterium ZM16-3]|nr:hypothetical protein [Chloroflexales bacterium ZM16-3]